MSNLDRDDEIFMVQRVHPNIVCKNCKYVLGSPQSASCLLFEYPESKPDAVYFDGKECEFRESK